MKHIDLFSGIGGFSLAFDKIFHEQKNEHIFVEYDPFCQAVLKKHWPDAEIHGDIRTFTNPECARAGMEESDTSGQNRQNSKASKSEMVRQENGSSDAERFVTSPFILTGGFPCQPFSQAGRRKGTADDRYLWPEMFRVICATKPQWVIAENVRGLVTWNEGMVLEQVCSDLESEGYEVQPFIIPAVAVNAPHRRDRIWIVAHARSSEHRGRGRQTGKEKGIPGISGQTRHIRGTGGADKIYDDSNSDSSGQSRDGKGGTQVKGQSRLSRGKGNKQGGYSWSADWHEVATRLCRMDDGLPRRMDRNPRLKALGNAIVPQVAEEIMKAIKLSAKGGIDN